MTTRLQLHDYGTGSKDYQTENIRNVVLIGSRRLRQSAWARRCCSVAAPSAAQGRVEDGTTVSDFDEEEIRRHISLTTALLPIEWGTHKLNVLDTPGFTDFAGEVKGAVRGGGLRIVVVDSVAGVEVGTELAWAYCNERNLPRWW